MSGPTASTSANLNPGNEYKPMNLILADISCTFEMAASRIRACIAQYQLEAAGNVPPSDRITYFKAGVQWEMNSFVTPLLQHSASKNIVSVVPVPVAHILKLYPMLAWNTPLPDIVSNYECPWWKGSGTIPDQPWQWDEVMASCISHFQCWVFGVEDDGLVLPEKLPDTSAPPLMGLRWIRERMVSLMQEQDEAIEAKMAEVKMYTGMLEKLKRAKGL
ncbi:hypothetical protein F4604DRAFT_1932980 [Suillus subluteus]|nr:hypothetical protein F4604DRAFT_1932980 [Suillus subluteus]